MKKAKAVRAKRTRECQEMRLGSSKQGAVEWNEFPGPANDTPWGAEE